MNVVKYTNALAVFLLLFIIYFLSVNFLGILYPKFYMDSWRFERYNEDYSVSDACTKVQSKVLKEDCIKKDKESFYSKKSEMLESARFDSTKSFVKNIIMLFVLLSYFLFFRKFIGFADYARENKYDSTRKSKSSYNRSVRK